MFKYLLLLVAFLIPLLVSCQGIKTTDGSDSVKNRKEKRIQNVYPNKSKLPKPRKGKKLRQAEIIRDEGSVVTKRSDGIPSVLIPKPEPTHEPVAVHPKLMPPKEGEETRAIQQDPWVWDDLETPWWKFWAW